MVLPFRALVECDRYFVVTEGLKDAANVVRVGFGGITRLMIIQVRDDYVEIGEAGGDRFAGVFLVGDFGVKYKDLVNFEFFMPSLQDFIYDFEKVQVQLD